MSKRKITIKSKITKTGLSLNANGETFRLDYPESIWRSFPVDNKELFRDNAVALLTMAMPLVSGIKEISYDTPPPVFRPFYYNVIMDSIPSATDDYPPTSFDVIRDFLNTEYRFKEEEIKFPQEKYRRPKRRAIVPLSGGKDSLLTLALAREIGLDPVAVYINDTVSPSENRIKLKFIKELTKKFGIKTHIVTNQIEKLNDFDRWNSRESCIGYMHMVTGFCLIALPIAYRYRARYIILGNQQDMNFPFQNQDGIWTHPSPDQKSFWRIYQDSLVRLFTGDKVRVCSLIEPLSNLAIVRLLTHRYPEFAKYWVSCDSLDASEEKRWCQECSKCARLSLFMRALGVDPRQFGLKRKMFTRGDEKYYRLFNGREVDVYEKSIAARDQQLLAFLMAYRLGETGYLINKFKSKFLTEARRREKKLRRFFFKK